MAERSVTVRLKADVGDFQAKMAAAATTSRAQLGAIQAAATKNTTGFNQLGMAAAAMGGALALGVGLAVNAFANFDQQMSNVQAATHESAAAMGQLREAALQAGADTAFSATEAAQGIEELAKAGVSTADIIGGGLAGALDLAAAGGISVAEAAETTATALQVFNLDGAEASHVADLLAAGAGKAQGSVSDMGMALDQGALVANQFGLSVEETTGALALFASEGLTGSDAGTSFKTMLLALANPSKEAADEMTRLGISVYDSTGQFIGMEGVAGQLQERMSGLDQETRNAALATIFGRDAIRSASILYEEGAAGVAEWAAKVDDSGYAAETAAIRMDNLRGDMEKLSGSIETALIGLGSQGDGPLRALVQQLTGAVNAFGEMGPGAQAAVLGVAGLTAAVLLLGGAALVLLPKLVAAKAAISTLGITGASAAGLLGGITAVVAGISAAFVGMKLLDPPQSVEAITESLARLANTGDVVGALANIDAGLIGTVQSADDLGQVLSEASGEMNNWWDAADSLVGTSALEDIRGIDEALAGLVGNGQAKSAAEQFEIFAEAGQKIGLSVDELIALFPAYAAAAEEAGGGITFVGDALNKAAANQRLMNAEMGGAFGTLGEVAASATETSETQVAASDAATAAYAAQVDEIRTLMGIEQERAGIVMSAAEAEGAYQESLRSLTEVTAGIVEEFGSLDEALLANGAGFDLGTDAGYRLQTATFAVAEGSAAAALAAYNLAEATGGDMVAAGGALVTSLQQSQDALYQTLVDMGIEEGAARTLAASIVEIPDISETGLIIEDEQAKADVAAQEARLTALEIARNTRLEADPAPAIAGAAAAQRAIDGVRDGYARITVETVYTGAGSAPGGSGQYTQAYGGKIPGTSPHARADNILWHLTAGEYVLPVPAVAALEREFGGSFLERLRTYQSGAGLAAAGGAGAGQSMSAVDAYTYARGGDGASAQATGWTSAGSSGALGWQPPASSMGSERPQLKEGDLTIVNQYPAPERASDAVARSARTAITLRRMGR